ncbi:MAG: tRNA pseudouridine(55) synthase TruB [Sphingomicrobium sp.]
MVDGWIVLDKPVGIGSTPCVSAVKRALREAELPKTKVGHGGTLDPLASGVLPIALGEATKLAGRMLDASKDYVFTVTFGTETDTLDLEGAVIASSPIRPTAAAVSEILPCFTGTIEQMPPAYSALKVDGKRAYDLARAGEDVTLATRQVNIHQLRLIEAVGNTATFATSVSKGTYIRSLARDIALALGTVGHVTRLRRTRAGPFDLRQAISLDNLGELAKGRALDGAVLPLSAGLDDIPALPVTPEEAKLLRHGQKLNRTLATPGLHLATDAGRPVALVEAGTDGLTVVRGFNI